MRVLSNIVNRVVITKSQDPYHDKMQLIISLPTYQEVLQKEGNATEN